MRRWPRATRRSTASLAGLLEIEVERGIGLAAGAAAAERGEGEAGLDEIVDALVLAPRPGQHDRIGAARLDDAAQALLLIVARRAHDHDQVEPAFGKPACSPIRNGMKNGSPYCWSPGCGCSMKAIEWVAPCRRLRPDWFGE